MGTARAGRFRERDLAKHETIYQHPDYHRIRAFRETRREEKRTASVLAGGSGLETIGGLAGLLLAVIGFYQVPFQMAGLATIAIGIGLLAQGLAVMSRWHAAMRKIDGGGLDRTELSSGISTEVFGGVVGILLGALALAGVLPLVLLPVAAMVFGGALLLGGAGQPDLVYLAPDRNPRYARMSYSAVRTSGGIMILVGVGSAVLGMLAVLGVGPVLTLTLVALLSTGIALLIAGGALTFRFVRRLT